MNALRRANRRVEYFGCEIFVPLNATHLACDSNGEVNAFNAPPEFSEDMRLFWGHSLGCVAEFDLDAEFDCINSVVEIGHYFDCVENGVDMSGFIMIGAIEIDEQEDVSFIIGQSIDTGNEGPLGVVKKVKCDDDYHVAFYPSRRCIPLTSFQMENIAEYVKSANKILREADHG